MRLLRQKNFHRLGSGKVEDFANLVNIPNTQATILQSPVQSASVDADGGGKSLFGCTSLNDFAVEFVNVDAKHEITSICFIVDSSISATVWVNITPSCSECQLGMSQFRSLFCCKIATRMLYYFRGDYMTTAERIRQRRKQIGMSADTLAEKIGVSRSTVFRYENGFIEKIPINNLGPIARALNTTIGYLMGWDENPEMTEPTPDDRGGSEAEAMHYFEGLSESRKAEALNYLRYLFASEGNQ